MSVFQSPVEQRQVWPGLAAFAQVERSGIRQGKPFERTAWFILSQVIDAQQVADMVQKHRGTTENKLHSVKDVVQREDASLIREPNSATLMAL